MAKSFQRRVNDELRAARLKFPEITSRHQAYAIILEELDEFWDSCKSDDVSDTARLLELVQIAAMAQRAAEDLELL